MKQYSFANTSLTINTVEISGYDEGDDVITMRRLNDNASHVIGADGDMTVSLSPDRSGEIIFRLNQRSDSNAYLSALVSAQETTNTLTTVAVQFTDLNDQDLISGTIGYIPRPADLNRGLNSQPQEWRIVVEKLSMTHLLGNKPDNAPNIVEASV